MVREDVLQEKNKTIIDSSPAAIPSTGSYFNVMQKRNGSEFGQIGIFANEERNPLTWLYWCYQYIERAITNYDDGIFKKPKSASWPD